MTTLKKVTDKLFSTSAAGMYMLVFAAAIGIATFIENDFGTDAAQKIIFQARWFEILLMLFGGTLLVNIIRFRMVQQKKWAILLFHVSMVVIIIGAGVTRYLGSEGIMHIREGQQTNLILSRNTFLQFDVKKDGKSYRFDQPVAFASVGNNRFSERYQVGDAIINVTLNRFYPNPVERISQSADGKGMIKIVVAGGAGREEYMIEEGEDLRAGNLYFNFSGSEQPDAVNIRKDASGFSIMAPQEMTKMTMATQQMDSLASGEYHPMQLRSLYAIGPNNFVVSDAQLNATKIVESGSKKMQSGSLALLDFSVESQGETKSVQVKGAAGMSGEPQMVQLDDMQISVSYGSKYIELPFSLGLREFIMERYPGTNSASSYASEVTLIDERNAVQEDHRIYMNNILNYGGYRFFQSSFDQDEKGTILSVNHDAPGTWISYFGYFLLTLGMIFTFLSKKSRFRKIGGKLQEMRASSVAIILLMVSVGFVHASDDIPEIDLDHAEFFSNLVVQDHRGRMKPIHTLASEVLRKVSRKEKVGDLTADQVFIGMMVYPDQWASTDLIYLGRHDEVKKLLGVEKSRVPFTAFFDGKYKLQDAVQTAVGKEAKNRNTFDKEVIKIDERVNICNMIFNGYLLRIFPVENAENDTWISAADLQRQSHTESDMMARFFPAYASAVESQNWDNANELVSALHQYQHRLSGDIMPSDKKIEAEIFLNKLNVFSRLGRIYGLLGLLTLILFFVSVFRERGVGQIVVYTVLGLISLAFLFHTVGLGLRWYVSGRAPWSNGYESMIYIGWTTVLAGVLFTRKSLGGLAATMVLSSTILMVAGLSWMDPEITPLVPVLRSYWLTIHVSLEAGSYGFLMLGAIIGVLNLILIIFTNANNQPRLKRKITELSYISEMTLIGGLVMISIGTYLGGVWANESWGRYWGWDAKETWALVTILVYAIVLHLRFIPGLRGFYAFNVGSLFGLASVMMTYFGVNYYLSGLHSYAAGDPVPIPSFVYYSVYSLMAISLLAYWQYRRYYLRG